MQLDSALAQQALDAAGRARDAGRAPDAVTVLRVALSVLEEAGADRLTRLKAMSIYSRMVRALQPLPAPSPQPFKGAQVRTVAASAGLLHRFLVGAEERFRLWLLMLGLGVRIVLRSGRRSADAATRHPQAPRPWDEFAEGVERLPLARRGPPRGVRGARGIARRGRPGRPAAPLGPDHFLTPGESRGRRVFS